MIDMILRFGTEIVFVRVNGHSVTFASSSSGNKYADISGLKLSKQGVIKEFPDLEGDDGWRAKAIDRFKERVKSFKDEDEVMDYVRSDLQKYGYVPMYKQKQGWRKERL